jgi:hypothetical protein
MLENLTEAQKLEVVEEMWKRGNLNYKRNPAQKKMHDSFHNTDDKIHVELASRRTGKTFEWCLEATEVCRKKEFAVVKFLCPTQKMVKMNIRPIMREILKDCPEVYKPEWKENDKVYKFPNGSEIQLAGTDNKAYQNLRGGASDLCIVDEAGFCSDLEDAVFSVLQPTTATTGGRIVLASTPSTSSNHEFIQIFVKPAMAAGKVNIFTIHDNTMIPESEKLAIIKAFPGGVDNPKYRREYLCEIITDRDVVVVPEFTDEKQAEIVTEVEMPPYFSTYVSADPGFRDLTAALFGYYDFQKARLVILDELILNDKDMTSINFATRGKDLEAKHFSVTNEIGMERFVEPMRFMDNNELILINDLAVMHEYYFSATKKDEKQLQINKLRMWLHNNRVIIHPRCKHLIYHLKCAEWDKNGKKFRHLPNTPDNEIRGGHADCLDALIYMVRNIDEHTNPYPEWWNSPDGENTMFRRKPEEGSLFQALKAVLNMNN